MIKIITYFLFCFFAATIYNNASGLKDDAAKKQLIIKAINEELKIHPKATLLDLYKNFFQGRFGPGHMIKDLRTARNYLKRELQQAVKFGPVLWQPVGHEKRYYRVNLCLVHDGKISMQQLIDSFVESANTAKPPALESWQMEWNEILKIIEQLELNLPDFEKDRRQIAENLKKGIVAGHHSPIYRNTYHPHYRIVSKLHFKKLFGK